MLRRMEIATRVVAAATFDEVDARRHHVVAADGHVGRRMCKAALVLLAIALASQKLTTDLPQPFASFVTTSHGNTAVCDIHVMGSVIFVTKIKTRTRIIGRRFQRTRTRIIVIQKTKTK